MSHVHLRIIKMYLSNETRKLSTKIYSSTDRFHSVCQWRQANSCTCMIYLEGLRDTFLLLYMDYCSTSAVLEHNDMNIVSDHTQNNRNTLNRQINRQESCAIAKMTVRCALYSRSGSNDRCRDMAIRNYPRWRPAYYQWICHLLTSEETDSRQRTTLQLPTKLQPLCHIQNNRTCCKVDLLIILSPMVFSILTSLPTASITQLKQLCCISMIMIVIWNCELRQLKEDSVQAWMVNPDWHGWLIGFGYTANINTSWH